MKFQGKNSIRDFANHLRKVQAEFRHAERIMLVEFGETAVHEIRDVIIGRTTPLEAVGPFPAWEPLQEDTVARKAKLGLGKDGDPNSMLYETGDLAQSITYTVAGRKCTVGTDDPKAAWHEYGTIHMRPRPFVGPGAIRALVLLHPRFQRILKNVLEGKRAS